MKNLLRNIRCLSIFIFLMASSSSAQAPPAGIEWPERALDYAFFSLLSWMGCYLYTRVP